MSENILIAADPEDLKPGEMAFYASSRPPLRSGQYRIRSEQLVKGLRDVNDTPQFIDQKPFVVSGPRFVLDATLIQMVYPPANQLGNFSLTLPNITLRRRSLPWERTLDDQPAEPQADTPPWLALITLYPEDLVGAAPFRIRVDKLLSPAESDVLPPAIDPATVTVDERKQELLAMDLDLETFRAIAPGKDDLPWLAHVRQVNTDGKEILGLDEDGWFSVVVGNRLGKPDAENTVFLVSLEGHGDHLHGSAEPPAQFTKIRLAALAGWRYTTRDARGSFIGLMQALPQRGGIELLAPAATAFSGSTSEAEKTAENAVKLGYQPLRNNTRAGEVTSSWYRGPLSPVPTKKDAEGPYYFSDRAIRYDPETGLFNLAFAAAWQIGRLLALSDAAFTRALFQWRRSMRNDRRLRRQTEPIQRHLFMNSRRLASSDNTETLLNEGLVHFWTRQMEPVLRHLQQDFPLVIPHEERDHHRLPGILSKTQQRRINEAGEDPLLVLLQHLHGTKLP